MATIDDKQIIYDLIRQNGFYDDDPRVAIIFSYLNDHGNTTQAIFYHSPHLDRQIDGFHNSPNVRRVQTLWNSKTGPTEYGIEWMNNYLKELKSCKP